MISLSAASLTGLTPQPYGKRRFLSTPQGSTLGFQPVGQEILPAENQEKQTAGFEPAFSALATRRDRQLRHACMRAKEVPVSFAPVKFFHLFLQIR